MHTLTVAAAATDQTNRVLRGVAVIVAGYEYAGRIAILLLGGLCN